MKHHPAIDIALLLFVSQTLHAGISTVTDLGIIIEPCHIP